MSMFGSSKPTVRKGGKTSGDEAWYERFGDAVGDYLLDLIPRQANPSPKAKTVKPRK